MFSFIKTDFLPYIAGVGAFLCTAASATAQYMTGFLNPVIVAMTPTEFKQDILAWIGIVGPISAVLLAIWSAIHNRMLKQEADAAALVVKIAADAEASAIKVKADADTLRSNVEHAAEVLRLTHLAEITELKVKLEALDGRANRQSDKLSETDNRIVELAKASPPATIEIPGKTVKFELANNESNPVITHNIP